LPPCRVAVVSGAVVGREVTVPVRFPGAGRTTGIAVVAAGAAVTVVTGGPSGGDGSVHPAIRSSPSVTRRKKHTVFSCMS